MKIIIETDPDGNNSLNAYLYHQLRDPTNPTRHALCFRGRFNDDFLVPGMRVHDVRRLGNQLLRIADEMEAMPAPSEPLPPEDPS
jgi:hypothetical protein